MPWRCVSKLLKAAMGRGLIRTVELLLRLPVQHVAHSRAFEIATRNGKGTGGQSEVQTTRLDCNEDLGALLVSFVEHPYKSCHAVLARQQ